MGFFNSLKNGIWKENPTFVQVIGMCPTLAITTNAVNGLGMGLSTMFVLTGSNLIISMLRKVIPDSIRIPSFVVIIAGFVTILEFLLQAYFPKLNDALGIYISLIVVNCIILARAEAFAFQNNVISSIGDGIGNGLGFTLALVIMGVIREFFGTGNFFNMPILPEYFPKTVLFILSPGAFFTLALIMGIMNHFRQKGC